MAEAGEISLTEKGFLKDLIVDQDGTILSIAEAFDADNNLDEVRCSHYTVSLLPLWDTYGSFDRRVSVQGQSGSLGASCLSVRSTSHFPSLFSALSLLRSPRSDRPFLYLYRVGVGVGVLPAASFADRFDSTRSVKRRVYVISRSPVSAPIDDRAPAGGISRATFAGLCLTHDRPVSFLSVYAAALLLFVLVRF